MSRAFSPNEVLSRRFKLAEFEGDWLSLVGKPELSGAWLIWGSSANGKTRFSLQLAKYMSKFGRVAYNSLEEGISESLKQAIKDSEFKGSNVIFLDKETLPTLLERLAKHKSPRIVIIDSLQYTGMTYKDYKKLKEQFPSKLFIFISHASGKEPKGRTAESIRYDVSVKIRIEGFKAFADSRYLKIKSEPYTIWHEGAEKYWMKR